MPVPEGQITSFRDEVANYGKVFFAGSRLWLDDLVDQFVSDKDARHLVIIGEPGVGKSVYMAHLAHRYSCPRYFTRAWSELEVGATWVDPRAFLISVGQQLGQKYGEEIFGEGVAISGEVDVGSARDRSAAVGTEIEEAHLSPFRKLMIAGRVQAEEIEDDVRLSGVHIRRLYDSALSMEPQALLHEAVLNPLQRIAEIFPEETVTLLLDGLDVSLKKSGPQILDVIPSAANLRLVITSRPGDHLSRFRREEKIALSETEEIEGEDEARSFVAENRNDVSAYIRHVVLNDAGIAPAVRASKQVTPQEFAEVVAERSAGNFLYVRHFFLALREDIQNDRVDFLRPRAVPRGLDNFYRAILIERIMSGVGEQRWEQVYVPVLGVLAVAREALGRKQMAHFAGVTVTQADSVRRRIGAFVDTLPGADGKRYRMYHASFAEYLLDAKKNDYSLDGPSFHAQIAAHYLDKVGQPWSECDDYGLSYLPTHLEMGGQEQALKELLLDFFWLQAKLDGLNVNEVMADFDLLPGDGSLRAVKRAIGLSAHVLLQDKKQLAGQLVGRLSSTSDPHIAEMLEEVQAWKGAPWLLPLSPSLIPPGGPLMRTMKGRLGGHAGTVRSAAITADGRWALTAGNSSNDGTVRLWNLETTECRHIFRDQAAAGGSTALAISASGRVGFTTYVDELRVWDLQWGELLETAGGKGESLTSLAVDQEGRRVIMGGDGGSVRFWDRQKQREVDLAKHHEPVRAVAITPDGRWGVSASESCLRAWDLATRQQRHSLQAPGVFEVSGFGWNDANLLALSDDGRRVLFGHSVKEWEVETGNVRVLAEEPLPGKIVAFTSDGRQAWIWKENGGAKLTLWDLAARTELLSLPHRYPPSALAMASGGRRGITADFEHDLFLWDLSARRQGEPGAFLAGELRFAGFGQEGRKIYFKREDGTHIAYLVEAGGLAPAPDVDAGEMGGEGTDAQDGSARRAAMEEKILRELGLVQDDTRGQERGWTTVSLASKWPRIVVADEAQRALSAYVPMGKYGDFQEPVQPVSGGSGWEILLWNVGEAITRTSLLGHSTPVTALDITPDGRWGISGCWGRVIRVWDLDAARQRRALPGHEGIVNAVRIAADGRRAASGSEDATLKVWDLETGDVVATFVGEGWITDCWIAPGGELFVAREGNEAQGIRYHVLRLCGPVS